MILSDFNLDFNNDSDTTPATNTSFQLSDSIKRKRQSHKIRPKSSNFISTNLDIYNTPTISNSHPLRKLVSPSENIRNSPLSQKPLSNKQLSKIPALHTHKPNFTNKKPQLTNVSNAMFFTILPSSSTNDIFNDIDTDTESDISSNLENSINLSDANNKSKRLSLSLLDPDLIITNSSNLFTNPMIIPNKQRTSLHFI